MLAGSNRRRAFATALAFVVLATLGAGSSAAADPEPPYLDAEWTVTRPNGTIRTDGSIAVGDDLSLTLTAIDTSTVEYCTVAIWTLGGKMLAPAHLDGTTCTFSIRLPDIPGPEYRATYGDAASLRICVAPGVMTYDGGGTPLADEDSLQPSGTVCGSNGGVTAGVLSFDLDEAGHSDRPFVSDPQLLSWDTSDWGTGQEPLQFGEPFTLDLPDWVTFCYTEIRGSWLTSVRPGHGDACPDWTVRLPGVMPAGYDFGGLETWDAWIDGSYEVVGGPLGPHMIDIYQPVPIETTDGVFESDLPAVWPEDLASTRFVTVGEPWQPVFQVSGMDAAACTMWLYHPGGTGFDLHETTPDDAGRCTFDLPALDAGEYHQYHVHAVPPDEPESMEIVFGGSISAIPAPEPPVIDPPTVEPGDDTGIEVEPGDGQGLVVELEITPMSTATATVSQTTAAAACADHALAPDLGSGGGIPTIEAVCDLPPGPYRAIATMLDVAGNETTALRTFTVAQPRPKITGRTPSVGASGVARDVRPSVAFDLPVSGVSTSTMRLGDLTTGTFVPATVSYDATTRRATLRPSSLLAPGHSYRLYLSSAITATATGRALLGTNWTFATTTDATAPTIIGRAPASGATGMTRTVTPAVRFSEPIKGVTVTSLQLRDTTTSAYVPATVRYDTAQRRASIDPTGTLAANRTYTVIVRSSISDTAGNPTATTTWSFRTGS